MDWKETKTGKIWEARADRLRLGITNGHIHYPGCWIGFIVPLMDITPLEATNLEAAKAEVIENARRIISKIADALESEAIS